MTGEIDEFAKLVQAAADTGMWAGDGAGGAETEIVPNIHSFDTMQAWAMEGPEVLDYPPTGSWSGDQSPSRSWRNTWVIAAGVFLIGVVVAIVVGVAAWPHTAPSTTTTPAAVGPPPCAPGHNSDPGCMPVPSGPPPVSAPVPAFNAAELADSLSGQLAEKYRRPDSVRCPTGIRGIVGNSVRCTITDNGATFGILVTVVSLRGENMRLQYEVDSGWPN
jgi:hypothetical protein